MLGRLTIHHDVKNLVIRPDTEVELTPNESGLEIGAWPLILIFFRAGSDRGT
jgi:hypothetical protein